MADPKSYYFTLPKSKRPAELHLVEPWYPGVQAYWSGCTTERSVNPIMGVVAVVIHATAGSSSAGAVSVMKKPSGAASFHWLVPDEDEPQHGQLVWACVPEALAAWHVNSRASHPDVNQGAKRVNHWSLGIEVVNAQKNDSFSRWQLQATAQIVRHCWAKYPNLMHVVSHAKLDPDRREDPGTQFDWNHFKSLVLNAKTNPPLPLVAAATPLSKIRVSSATGCCNT
jgi:N-acetyl-anhydromuramyl-L-alanine amidase AmpD